MLNWKWKQISAGCRGNKEKCLHNMMVYDTATWTTPVIGYKIIPVVYFSHNQQHMLVFQYLKVSIFFYNCVLKNMLYLLGRFCSINNDKWIFHIVSYFYMVKWVWCIALFNVVAAVQGGLLISFWVFGVITDCGVGWAWPCCLPVIHRANIDISGDS